MPGRAASAYDRGVVVVNRVARALVLLALVWSLGSVLAAVNWHSNWTETLRSGHGGTEAALHYQERWQHYVDMTLIGVVVTVLALALALWPLLRAAGDRALRDADGADGAGGADGPAGRRIDLRGAAGFGGGSEEVRRHADHRDGR